MANDISSQLYSSSSTLSVPQMKAEVNQNFEQAVKADAALEMNRPAKIHLPSAEMEHIAKELAETAKAMNRRLEFKVDESTSGQVVVKVIDGNTDKVIKELPPEELQNLHKRLKEAFGVLLDQVI